MKKQNNFVAKHNHNRASVHRDRSKEIPRDMKYEEDLLEYLDDIQGEDMNKKIGDKGKAVCNNCEAIKDITYKNSDVPLSDDGGIVEHILVGVCDDCDSVVLIPHQSTSKIGEYLRG